jgi:uncharacterized protein (UPF0248 family)
MIERSYQASAASPLNPMQPLHQLLNRIKWDRSFGSGHFAIGYLDRVAGEERVVPFAATRISPAAASFVFEDEHGVVQRIPLHRVRRVYKNGVVIWERKSGVLSR